MRLRDKDAVITGGAQGIDYACAERFVAEGCRVLLVDRDAARGRDALAKLRNGSGTAELAVCDVGVSEQLAAMVAQAERTWCGICCSRQQCREQQPHRFPQGRMRVHRRRRR